MANCTRPEWHYYVYSKVFIGISIIFMSTQMFAQSTLSRISKVENQTTINEITNFLANEEVEDFYSISLDGLLFVQKKYWHDFYMLMHIRKVNNLETLQLNVHTEEKVKGVTFPFFSREIEKKPFFKNPSFKVLGGTRGVPGVELNFWISPRINLAIGYGHLRYSVEKFESNFGLSEYYATIDAQINLSNFNVLAEYKPWRGGVRIVTGFAWFPKNKLSGIGTLRDGFQFNDILFTPEELGAVGGAIEYKWKINPYAGIGFGRSHPKGRFGFTFDIGVFYKGKPQLTLEATSLARHNVLNEEKIQKIIGEYQWWPVIDLGIKYRIF